ncbi:hypothetical protein [Paraliobacillus ryukyuensis]|uniref:hypothetical protein n=1 Tax=Paraliobacillus ryukyuensis TaxID=200904 RepID=UPI0009A8A99F|nr:hypothetical protein [Paraliobacillus ryukyuensis]
MAKKKQIIKLNKKHNGKEFKSFFHFVGKIKPATRFENNIRVNQPYLEERETSNGNTMRKLLFVIETADHNDLEIQLIGFPQDKAYLYSQSEGKSYAIDWKDRTNKDKYPNDTYHLIETDWDKAERIGSILKDGKWMEVKGKYEFGSLIDSEKGKINFKRRIVNDAEPIENGQEIKAGKATIVDKYVTDFESEEFKEVNFVSMQIGINSTYQEEEGRETKINAYFLDYGKEKSTPYEVELDVPYVEPEGDNISLADAFTKLNKFDFVEVQGRDNNRAIFSEVEEETDVEDDPFASVGEENTVSRTNRTITGTDKGVKVHSIVNGTYMKDLLTEEEVTEKPKNNSENNPFKEDDKKDKEDNKENNDDNKSGNPFEENKNEDPFADEDDPFKGM